MVNYIHNNAYYFELAYLFFTVAHQTGFHKLIGSGRKYKSGHSSVIISLELDYDDCVEKCFEDVNCNSFSLCSTSKECTLSKFNLQTLDDVKSLTDYGECIIVASILKKKKKIILNKSKLLIFLIFAFFSVHILQKTI